MELKKLQKIGGICAILEALIYIFAFIVYGGILVYPNANASAVEQLNFLNDNYLTLSILNLISYVLFGIILAVLVLAIHQRLKNHSPIFSNLASIFGIIWVGLVIASGMIANIGLNSVLAIGTKEPDNAMLVWSSVSVISEGLGGGNEIVGGIWVLLLSIIAFKGQIFSKPLIVIGILVGIAGILTIYPLEIFTEIFGISQIIWFVWVGIFMIRKPTIIHNDLKAVSRP
ncbi:hypothetical protein Murru_3005 [Allomuricauda ruestringensis DSM 13258]|uniref:DUF4386 family protein n=1 Tax=Allomuricauda ruestringensis (strain DSM 13258 / CIP 107369 / LMG 19739 / B1) TaxID=886377 RepID=G2PK42_ALLRU|nr:DUF4386 family protein [Allomuricauda ruestringensis]AEM72027.1 hypothetical protein Murru_3005 [Allomuricauda ruestringensis DSM 13258]